MADEPQLNLEGADKGASLVDRAAAAAPAPSIALADLTAAGIPESFIKDGVFDAKALAASITEGAALKTASEERAKLIPADGKYDFGLPKDWKAPEGLEGTGFEWNFPPELAAKFSERAKAKGMTQADVSEFISDWAAGDLAKKVAAAKVSNEATAAEMAKLGAGAKDRLTAIDSYLKANLGADAAVSLTRELTTAASIEAAEKLIKLAGGSKMAPNAGAGSGGQSDNAKNAELAGTPGSGRKLLEAAHAAKH